MVRILSSLLIVATGLIPGAVGSGWAQGGLQQRIAELSQQIANEMTQYQKTAVAVVEFSDLQGNVTDFGRFVAEELITRLYQTRKFKVIERQLLNKIIAEQKLTLSGVVDPASARQLGKLLGVEAIASGTITDLGQSLRLNARLISTETGEVFSVASTEIFKDESVTRLLAAGTTAPAVAPPGAPPAVPSSGGGLRPGRVIELSGISVQRQGYTKITITSLEVLPEGRLRVNFFHENTSNDIYVVRPYTQKGYCYIVDDRGDQYDVIEAERISDEGRQVPPGAGIRYSLIFAAPPADAKTLSPVWDGVIGCCARITWTFPKITVR